MTADDQLQLVSAFRRVPHPPKHRDGGLRRGMIAGVIGILLLLVGAAGWYLRSPGFDDIPPAPRLSIVVLPFANLSDDPEQQYFADGITEDLTTDLSRIADMLVISRNTAFTYRDKPINAKQIGRELGVRYVLEGSVQRSGNQVRINAQLIDAETDAHLWAERFDRDIGDLFALQNEITGRIAIALNLELIAAEAARPTEHPDALDYILRGRAAVFGSRHRVKAMRRRLACSSTRWRSIRNPSRRRAGWRTRWWAACSMERATRLRPTLHARKRWSSKPWRHRPAARSRITSKAKCCALRTDARRPFPNTRR